MSTQPDPKHTDNFRYFRRYLQGRGVNLRQTIIDGDAAQTRILLPGWHPDDRVISVINLTDLADLNGDLDLTSYEHGDPATVDIFSGNKGITFSAQSTATSVPSLGEPDGNLIDIEAIANPAGASQPLTIVIGPRDLIKGTTGHRGRLLLQIRLATDESNVVDTGIANSAANVKSAILVAQKTPQFNVSNDFPDNRLVNVVNMVLDGDGSTSWTTHSLVPMTGGTPDGPKFGSGVAVAASLVTALDYTPYFESEVRYVARKPGTAGNDITVEYAAGSELGVGVSGPAIFVVYVVGETTAQDVIATINHDSDASALVLASLIEGPVPNDADGSGLIATMVATPLTGGLDPGIRFNVDTSGKKLLVTWVTRDDGEDDEED